MPILTPVTLSDLTTPFTLLNNPDSTGGFGGSVDTGGSTRSLNFLVKFDKLEAFLKEIAGLPVLFGSGTTGTIERALPLQYPWNPYLYAARMSLRGAGSDSEVSSDRPWTYAIVTVEFTTLDFDPKNSDQPYLSVRVHGSSSFITLPGVAFSFAGNGEKIEQDVGKLCGEKTIEVTKYAIPDLDQFQAVCDPILGKVNSATVTIGKTAYAAGYLLFSTYSADSEQNVLGTPKYRASLMYSYRAIKWNQAMRSDGTYDDLSPAPYTTGDISTPLSI